MYIYACILLNFFKFFDGGILIEDYEKEIKP